MQAAQGEHQYGEVWRVINEMTGRKRTKEGQVEGHSPEERVTTWSSHFQKLLGVTADAAEEEEIPLVLQNLSIDDGPFTLRELARAKTTVRGGKSAGPDGIPPEVRTAISTTSLWIFATLLCCTISSLTCGLSQTSSQCPKLETSQSRTTTEASP